MRRLVSLFSLSCVFRGAYTFETPKTRISYILIRIRFVTYGVCYLYFHAIRICFGTIVFGFSRRFVPFSILCAFEEIDEICSRFFAVSCVVDLSFCGFIQNFAPKLTQILEIHL